MNEIYLLLYSELNKLSDLKLKFNYIPAFHRANFLSLSVKKGDIRRFCNTAKVSPTERWDVIKVRGMIALLSEITVI